ncbi:MAG: autotransporter domain-containing protein, partial [bacterium]
MTTATASFAIDDDEASEPAATGANEATATIAANAEAYQLGSPSSAAATICDDDGDAPQPECRGTGIGGMAAAEVAPAVAAAIAGNVAGSIANRVGAANAGGGIDFDAASMTTSFATQAASAMADGAELESVVGDGVKRLLDGKTYSMALSGDGGASGGAGVWIGGAHQSLGGEDEDGTLDWDGELYSVQFGVDARLSNGMLAGAAVSRSEGEWDYESVDMNDMNGAPVEGVIELRATSIHPYLAWRAGDLDAWASVGHGVGNLEIRPVDGTAMSGDVVLRSAAVGGASGDFALGASAMRLKFGAQVANMEVDYGGATASGATAADLEVDSRRVRVGVEWGDEAAAGGTRRALEFGARYDGGDIRAGVGAEIGASLAHDTGDGVSASLNARA